MKHAPGDEGSDLCMDPETLALALGLLLVQPQPDELFVDLDREEDRDVLKSVLGLLRKHGFPLHVVNETVSPGGNAHVYLQAGRRLSDIERIALQAMLGSDRKREAYSFLRLTTKTPPTVFFENPNEGR